MSDYEALKSLAIKLDRSVKNPIKTPDHLFELPGVWVGVAKRNSGKTTACASLLRDYEKAGLMDRCWLISPNADSHVNRRLFEGIVQPEDTYSEPTWDSVHAVLDALGEEAEIYEQYLEAKKVYAKVIAHMAKYKCSIADLPDDLLCQWYRAGLTDVTPDGQLAPPTYKYGDKHPCFFVLLDDVQGTKLMSPSTSNPVNNCALRNRHLKKVGVTLIFLTQSYSAQSGLQPFIRANATMYMLWRLASQATREKFAAELANDVDSKEFLEKYDLATSDDDPHGFLTLDMQAPRSRRFRQNFDRIV